MIHEKKSLKTHIKDYIVITIASFFYGLAISQFLDPNDIAPGGVSGLSMILNRLIPIEVGTLILMINIPILLLGLWKFGFRFLISTIYATFMGSVMTNITAMYPPVTTDPLLATIGGCAIASIAIGFIFKSGALYVPDEPRRHALRPFVGFGGRKPRFIRRGRCGNLRALYRFVLLRVLLDYHKNQPVCA